MTDPATPNRFKDATTIPELLGQLVGAGSTCWIGGTGDAVFDTHQANSVVDQGVTRITEMITGAFDDVAENRGTDELPLLSPIPGGYHVKTLPDGRCVDVLRMLFNWRLMAGASVREIMEDYGMGRDQARRILMGLLSRANPDEMDGTVL